MNDPVYETGIAAEVRAFHVMPGLPPPEGVKHAHAYRLDVVVSREDLDEHGMVVDIDRLQHALRGITDRVDGADLDEVVAAEIETAVTVEVFARWVHNQLALALDPATKTTMSVRVWESPVAFGGYVAVLPPGGRSR